MFRYALLIAALAPVRGPAARAEDWADRMFRCSKHDFGVVAEHAEASWKFEFWNVYRQDVRVVSVRSSCGCTTPKIVTDTDDHMLKTYDEGYVLARLNTSAFTGAFRTTITVVLEFTAADGGVHRDEAQLQITGTVQENSGIAPAELHFGSVRRGTAIERSFRVFRRHQPDWHIVEARTECPWLSVDVADVEGKEGRTEYLITVRLSDDAPEGSFRQRIELATNEQDASPIQFDATGRVTPEVAIVPAMLTLGELAPGQQCTKRIVVRCHESLRILGVECSEADVTAEVKQAAARVRFITLVITAPTKVGPLRTELQIKTNSPRDESATLPLQMTVVAAP